MAGERIGTRWPATRALNFIRLAMVTLWALAATGLSGCASTAFHTDEIAAQTLDRPLAPDTARVVIYRKDDVGWERAWLFIDGDRIAGHLAPYRHVSVDLNAGPHKVAMTLVGGHPDSIVYLTGTPEVEMNCEAGRYYYVRQAWAKQSEKPALDLVDAEAEWSTDLRAMRPSGSKIIRQGDSR